MEPQPQETIGLITPDGELVTNSIITNNAATATSSGSIEHHEKNLTMDHMYGMVASSSNIFHTPPSPSMTSMRGRSKVWNEFSVTADGKKVTCHRCGDCLAYSNSHSTSSMLKHLKRKHSLDLYPPATGNEGSDTGAGGSLTSASQPKDTKLRLPAASSISNNNSVDKRLRPAINRPAKKHIPKDAEEIDTSVQHGPLLFQDPCVRMKWTDHSDTFLRTFSTLYSDETYTDVSIVVEKHFFRAHRVILSSASEFFDESFRMTPTGQHPIIFLKDVKAMDFRILLDFIYKGEVAIPPSLIPGLVKVGSELRVRGLSDFVWNEQLASSVFAKPPQQQTPAQPMTNHSENCRPLPQMQSTQAATPNVPQGMPMKITAPVRTFIRHPAQTQHQHNMGNGQQQQGRIIQPTRMYSRIVNIRPNNSSNGVPETVTGGASSTNEFQGQIITGDLDAVCSTVANSFPSMKRIRIVTSEPRLSPQIRQVTGVSKVEGDGNINGSNNMLPTQTATQRPETVLMVTNEGETLLSTTQGSVTVLTQPNAAQMTIPFDAQGMQTDQDDPGDSLHTEEQQQQLRPVITAVTSQAHQHPQGNYSEGRGIEQTEVIYSIAEMSNDGGQAGDDDNEVLSHQDHEMTSSNAHEESLDKKPFLHN